MAADYLRVHGIDLQREIDTAQNSPAMAQTSTHSKPNHSEVTVTKNARLSGKHWDVGWHVNIQDGKVDSLEFSKSQHGGPIASEEACLPNGTFRVLLPSLCHPHIHLDKCFLLSHLKYVDLEIVRGDFAEALELTSEAKKRFEEDDLITRGRWLIQESIAAGVTHMRAFVEVDTTVQLKCLDAGLRLKAEFRHRCEIQLCVFAQDPLFSPGTNYPEGKALIETALSREGVDALGTTPYVEDGETTMCMNVDWAVTTAVRFRKHLDFHLDYNLDPTKPPLIHYVIDRLHAEWGENDPDKTIVFGHCTRLTLFAADEWRRLRAHIANLPVYFVGLPNSDLYMMGKPSDEEGGGQRVRGTLQIPQMIQKYGLKGAIGVNNVGNAFTPQGNCDPLSIASMGVGIYQAGTKADCQVLYDCVARNAKTAIGFAQPESAYQRGAPADFVLLRNGGGDEKNEANVRHRRTLQELIYDPPRERQTVKGGFLCL